MSDQKSSLEKPTLESRILHLCKSDGASSGYVILLDQKGNQTGGLFDLKDEESNKQLQAAFSEIYDNEHDRYVRWAYLRKERVEKLFDCAKKIKLSEYKGVGFWWGDHFFYHFDAIYNIILRTDKKDRPNFVWAAKITKIEHYSAQRIWERHCEELNLEDWPEYVPGSEKLLDLALLEFYKTNEDRLVSFEIDYSTAIELDYPTSTKTNPDEKFN